MKARLRGDLAAVAKYEARLSSLGQASATPGAAAPPPGAAAPPTKEEVVVVTPLDAAGRPIPSLVGPGARAAPAVLERDDTRTGHRKGKRKAAVALAQGTSMGHGYFPEDVQASKAGSGGQDVTELLRSERMTGRRANLDEDFARNILRMGKRFRGDGMGVDVSSGKATDGEGTGAGGSGPVDMRLFQGDAARLTGQAAAAKDKARAVAATRAWEKTTATCQLCLASDRFKSHMVVALGRHCLLILPPWQRLVPGHVLIVPKEHVASMTLADEEVYREANAFKAALFAMFAAEGEEPVFLEVGGRDGSRGHAYIQCLPMEQAVAEDAPIFFHKALSEAEEWSTNKAVIDCRGKGLRGAVPSGFAYFHVGWRGGGYAHVIEDADRFPRNWGLDIVAGMMGLPPGGWGRKASATTASAEAAEAAAFAKRWAPFDITAPAAGHAASK